MAPDRAPPSSPRTPASRRRTVAAKRPARQSRVNTQKYSQARRQNRPGCMHSNRRALFASFDPDLPYSGRIDGKMGEVGVPVLRDLQPGRHPHPLMLQDVVEKPQQRGRAAGTSDHAAMQADRHHLGRSLAFGIKHVETILTISAELIPAAKTLRVD